MNKQKIIILRGYPGSGKTTIGRLLEKGSFGIFIDHNKILTFIATITGDDSGIYDEIQTLEQAMTFKLLSENKSVIVARGFNSESSIRPYVDIAYKTNVSFHIFQLSVNKSNLAKRVSAEERKQDFNPVTTREALANWLSTNPMEAVREEHVIDANQPPEEVFSQIKSLLGP